MRCSITYILNPVYLFPCGYKAILVITNALHFENESYRSTCNEVVLCAISCVWCLTVYSLSHYPIVSITLCPPPPQLSLSLSLSLSDTPCTYTRPCHRLIALVATGQIGYSRDTTTLTPLLHYQWVWSRSRLRKWSKL